MSSVISISQQSQELLNNNDLIEILNGLSQSSTNNINSLSWTFKNKYFDVTTDFSSIENLKGLYPDWFDSFPISPTDMAKYIWLNQMDISSQGAHYFIGRFNGLVLLFYFLAQNNWHRIDRENLFSFIEWFLLHDFNKFVFKRPSIKSYALFIRATKLTDINLLLKEIGIDNFIQDVKEIHIDQTLKNAIDVLSGGEVTYNQWKDGGTFNFLTLDYGRYYVDYCQEYFSQYINHAHVLMRIMNESKDDLQRLGAKGKTDRAVLRILSGEPTDNLIKEFSLKRDVAYEMAEILKSKYQRYMLPLLQHDYLLSDESIDRVIKRFNLSNDLHIRDKITFLVEHVSLSQNIELVRKSFNGDLQHISLEQLTIAINEIKQSAPVEVTMPDSDFYEQLGIPKTSRSIINSFVKTIRDAGLTYFVSLNGWRKSEYGFPLTSVSSIENTDPLDKHAYPIRFIVDWHVFKTHGDTITQREITHTSYRLINQLSLLHESHETCPAMYFAKADAKDLKNSGKRIEASVKSNWTRFIDNYEPFKAIGTQNQIDAILAASKPDSVLSFEDAQKIQGLQKIIKANDWQKYIEDNELRDAYERAQRERTRVDFYLTGPENKSKKNWLIKYKSYLLQGDTELPSEWITMLDKHLSDDTKDYIRSSEDSYLKTNSVSKIISAEVIEGCLYPTPHAFRHMWAEAVYRRFDGDVGWMIRSQFKHITMGMWLAYIRDKDNRNLNNHVQVAVKTSLLNNWLQNEGKEHAGRFHVFLRRLFKVSKLQRAESLHAVIENLARIEITDIKANPWGFCLLRRTNKELAKCAEDGVPQRQNATPSLCLGCHHNLTKSSNVDYIVFETMQHIALLSRNDLELFPQNILWSSYDLIKKAHKHISNLSPDNNVLEQYQTAMIAYEKLAKKENKNA